MDNELYASGNTVDSPLLIEIEPAHGCNLRCIMCHVPAQKDNKPIYLDVAALERSTVGIENCHVIIGSEYEPTIHPQFEQLLRLTIKRKWKLDLLTNGVNLKKFDKELLADVRFHVFNASFDGFSAATFSKIRLGANYEKVKQNILEVAAIARSSGGYTAINSTIMQSSLHETKDLVQMWDAEGFDLVRLLVVQARDTSDQLLDESLYPIKHELISVLNEVANLVSERCLRIGVRNGHYGSSEFRIPVNLHVNQATIYSDNPDSRHVPGARQDIQLGEWPGMSVSCRSPFVYCRVKWDGTVDLCNKRDKVIGDIYKDNLLDIWNGHKALTTRREILSDSTICKHCDYFRFCIKSRQQDYLSKEEHFAHGIIDSQLISNFIEISDAGTQ